MPVKMNETEEKVFKYLLDHKTPVQADKLAKRFIWSQSKAASILNKLVDAGVADLIRMGTKKFYKFKD